MKFQMLSRVLVASLFLINTLSTHANAEARIFIMDRLTIRPIVDNPSYDKYISMQVYSDNTVSLATCSNSVKCNLIVDHRISRSQFDRIIKLMKESKSSPVLDNKSKQSNFNSVTFGEFAGVSALTHLSAASIVGLSVAATSTELGATAAISTGSGFGAAYLFSPIAIWVDAGAGAAAGIGAVGGAAVLVALAGGFLYVLHKHHLNQELSDEQKTTIVNLSVDQTVSLIQSLIAQTSQP